ncbi:hypothetical protein VC83_00114 [Pseudogymnoascus destructans]|uniref:SNF2 N-terminal domain-containing protein n=1 Tax=Pseudogymnoascus destructans TaxID=655981 RepID=A0A177ALR7_9PEZI|nr:uncharacterized protein VC83_00114 [Pseudogymnoascus destructans]OAF63007.1 hypothetical protein VC83_00114 [Pseudogymnoascus destructans]
MQIHVAVARLCVKYHWFLTGTPVQNQSLDILGPLNILWPEIRKGAYLTKERIRWLGTLKGTYQDFNLLLEPDGSRLIVRVKDIPENLRTLHRAII